MNAPQHALRLAGQRVLEDWAMMMVDHATSSTTIFETDQSILASTIRFKGVIDGTVTIVAQQPFIETLARNLLGYDDDANVDTEEVYDAFREMANVLTGNFLTEAYGDDTVFDVVLPEVSELAAPDLEKIFKSIAVQCFRADEHPISMTFDVIGAHGN